MVEIKDVLQSITIKQVTFNKDKTKAQVIFVLKFERRTHSETVHLEKNKMGWWRDKHGIAYDLAKILADLQP